MCSCVPFSKNSVLEPWLRESGQISVSRKLGRGASFSIGSISLKPAWIYPLLQPRWIHWTLINTLEFNDCNVEYPLVVWKSRWKKWLLAWKPYSVRKLPDGNVRTCNSQQIPEDRLSSWSAGSAAILGRSASPSTPSFLRACCHSHTCISGPQTWGFHTYADSFARPDITKYLGILRARGRETHQGTRFLQVS